jgi:hypothetical protein
MAEAQKEDNSRFNDQFSSQVYQTIVYVQKISHRQYQLIYNGGKLDKMVLAPTNFKMND